MRIGFSGSRKGFTNPQHHTFRAVLKYLHEQGMIEVFTHGDCIGADSTAHDDMRALDPSIPIRIHPPDDPKLRAFKQGDFIAHEAPYLKRNRTIAKESHLVVICPSSMSENTRSGTWATWRYAFQMYREIILLSPNGNQQWVKPQDYHTGGVIDGRTVN